MTTETDPVVESSTMAVDVTAERTGDSTMAEAVSAAVVAIVTGQGQLMRAWLSRRRHLGLILSGMTVRYARRI